jgi:hypothetical protein
MIITYLIGTMKQWRCYAKDKAGRAGRPLFGLCEREEEVGPRRENRPKLR